MGGSGRVGVGWEGRMGAVSRSCWVPDPQGKPLLSCGFWWMADSQALVL